MKKHRILIFCIVSLACCGGAIAGEFNEYFDGDPAEPTSWNPENWDIVVHSRDVDTWQTLEPMAAAHGPGCAGPPATHTVTAYEDAVFQCRNHVMTAINAKGYGAIYATPNQLVDFNESESVVRFDMSTLRTSHRDWVDIRLTPFTDNLILPGDTDLIPDLTGHPRHSLQISMGLND